MEKDNVPINITINSIANLVSYDHRWFIVFSIWIFFHLMQYYAIHLTSSSKAIVFHEFSFAVVHFHSLSFAFIHSYSFSFILIVIHIPVIFPHSYSFPIHLSPFPYPLWARIIKNQDKSTGPLARPFARSLVPLTHSLAPSCLLCLSSPLHSLVRSPTSLTPSLVGQWMIGWLLILCFFFYYGS